ncbi:MAG TPA: ribosome small subunit-dependent GTPase A [Planctomycetes bacterium]|nr:ribosome small subunit-dependent GTPase A [Planctomycetota bacterium]
MTQETIGTVVRGDARVVHVELDGSHESRQFALRGKLFEKLDDNIRNPIAVGDRVRVSLDGDPPAVEEVLPRRNWLPRISSSHDPRHQILFANVDQLFVVGSIQKPRFSSNRTDRILAACVYHEIPTGLILNKVDLDKEGWAADIRETYEAAGTTVLETRAIDGELADLRERLAGKISVLYGASGAGKSTILNTLEPGLKLKTAKISKHWDAGRHTTTFSRMYRLAALDAHVIDTPGIRVFRIADVNKAELRDCFPEFAPFQARCRFPDCSHDHEPGCEVFPAVERGELAPSRYASYVEILDELAPPPPDDTPEPPPEG